MVNDPITARSSASSTKFPYSVRAVPNRACSPGAPNTAKIATSTPQPQNTRPSWIGVEAHQERRVAEQGEEAPVVEQPGHAGGGQAAVLERLERPAIAAVRRRGVAGSSTTVATSAIAISTETPKNGPRQLMLPSTPPSSGPAAMPTPSAVS